MKTTIRVDGFEIYGRVAPMPHLMNIFEYGAQIPARTNILRAATALYMPRTSGEAWFGRSAAIPSVYLHARPVVEPAKVVMGDEAVKRFERVLQRIAHQ
jgi:hypothetical protein